MLMFVVQSAVLLALAFVVGCIAGTLAFQAVRRPVATLQKSLEPAPAMARLSRQASPPQVQPAETRPQADGAKPQTEPAAEPGSTGDDLKMIRGIGRQIEIRLHNLGVHSFAQIAAWTANDRREWGQRLAFPGRIEREDWVGQARKLAKGGRTAFSRRVARGEVPTSRGKPRPEK